VSTPACAEIAVSFVILTEEDILALRREDSHWIVMGKQVTEVVVTGDAA
jgi:hypothetical protein